MGVAEERQPPSRRAVIIGAGPAGLTAAYELLTRTDITPLVLERDAAMGGLSRTVVHNGNRIDIGGHRFFSKSDRVMCWWQQFLPLERLAGDSAEITYQGRHRVVEAGPGPDPATSERVMLLRPRRSRIYHRGRFFDYPIAPSPATLRNLGLWRTLQVGFSYLSAVVRPIRPELNLEQFFINRFGRELYQTFFKDYTEKVWGTSCRSIPVAWGAQRVKGLSISSAIAHFLRQLVPPGLASWFGRDRVETSLIERFLYPKLGPGQMWEAVAGRVVELGGGIRVRQPVTRVLREGERIVAVETTDTHTGEARRHEGDLFFSTMPIRDLVQALDPPAPPEICALADGLVYRDFITVGLLLDQLQVEEPGDGGARGAGHVRDTWIYIQEPAVKVCRLQIFNNWSPYLVADPATVWIGLEYLCNEGDALWTLTDAEMVELATGELGRIGIIDPKRVHDAVVIRVEKAYPAYFGTYDRFAELRAWLDRFENLYLLGRNGMHRYNNQDHSMLTAMAAVDNLVSGRRDKANLWEVNTDDEYHEQVGAPAPGPRAPGAPAD